jgi:hypothetical protein
LADTGAGLVAALVGLMKKISSSIDELIGITLSWFKLKRRPLTLAQTNFV